MIGLFDLYRPFGLRGRVFHHYHPDSLHDLPDWFRRANANRMFEYSGGFFTAPDVPTRNGKSRFFWLGAEAEKL